MVNASKDWTPRGKVKVNPVTGQKVPVSTASYDYQLNWIQAGQPLSQLFQTQAEAEEVATMLRDKYAAPTHIGQRGDMSWLEALAPEVEF